VHFLVPKNEKFSRPRGPSFPHLGKEFAPCRLRATGGAHAAGSSFPNSCPKQAPYHEYIHSIPSWLYPTDTDSRNMQHPLFVHYAYPRLRRYTYNARTITSTHQDTNNRSTPTTTSTTPLCANTNIGQLIQILMVHTISYPHKRKPKLHRA